MEELEFRVWLPHSGMLYDPYIGRDKANKIFNKYWMQYIGVKDKNGKKIFRCDVVQTSTGIYLVEYNAEYAGFEPFIRCDYGACSYHGDNYLILGNIYENPELKEKLTDANI